MIQGRGHPLVFLALSLALSACVEGAARSATPSETPLASAAAPAPEENTGSISGKVVDDEERPLAGAKVGDITTNLQTTTDESGAFTFNGLAPGQYQLIAQRLGFHQVAKKVEVMAGEVAQVTLMLTPLVIEKEWVQVLTKEHNPVGGPYVQLVPNTVQAWTGTLVLGDNPKALRDLVFEVVWPPATALSDGGGSRRPWTSIPATRRV